MEPALKSRLQDLLVDPSESLDVELKGWLNLKSDNEHKAILAKSIIAIANHGGGFIILGLSEKNGSVSVDPESTIDISQYNQDMINGIVQSYIEPAFHCSVHRVPAPSGQIFPIVSVPGGHRVPIRAKRGGPGNQILVANGIYIRRPGPSSEQPQNSQEWDQLLQRCMLARRDEMLDQIRNVVLGSTGNAYWQGALKDEFDVFSQKWIKTSLSRLSAIVGQDFTDEEWPYNHGHYLIVYRIGGVTNKPSAAALLELMRRSTVRHTGWPAWWVPTRDAIRPYINEGSIECWLGEDKVEARRDPAHSDFWRVSPEGHGFLFRGFDEDGPDISGRSNYKPGTVFELTLPIWRISDAVIQVASLARNLVGNDATIEFMVRYYGLKGRELVSFGGRRHLIKGRKARQDKIDHSLEFLAGDVPGNLVEIVTPLLRPVYELFDFFELSPKLVAEEFERMRSNKF